MMDAVLAIDEALAEAVDALTFAEPVHTTYNPLRYAWMPHAAYVQRFAGTGQVLLLGMNPGPWGMAQTGVPFGEIAAVRDWMGINEPVEKPAIEHPKREVLGFQQTRSEVSGRRLWGWAAEHFGTAEAFFARFYVVNYCPLSFMEESGRNLIPEKLPKAERELLFEACGTALQAKIDALAPSMVIGVGAFAEKMAKKACKDRGIPTGRVLHPSPASPKANRGWAEAAVKELTALGVL